jgi:hypothetical protein
LTFKTTVAGTDPLAGDEVGLAVDAELRRQIDAQDRTQVCLSVDLRQRS